MPSSGAAWLSLARVVKRAVKSYKRAQPNFLVGLFSNKIKFMKMVKPIAVDFRK